MKKVVAILLILSLALLLLSGCGTGDKKSLESTSTVVAESPSTVKQVTKSAMLFDEPVTLSIMTPGNSSWPLQNDWYVFKKIKELTNVTLDVTSPTEGYNDKVSITIASGKVPDIMFLDLAIGNKYGQEGAFINLFDYEKDMPNFLKWKSDDINNILPFLTTEGKLYLFSANEIGETNRMGWLYREDIFRKNNLQVPANDEELYNVLKKLKELYPDSYPLTFRNPLQRIALMATSWGAGNNAITYPPYYYEKNTDTWKYGPIEEGYKNLVTFMNKLYREKLIPPDILSLDAKTWQDRVSANSVFITMDYLVRIDFFNTPLRKDNPEFTLTYMPPFKGGSLGSGKKANTACNYGGNAIYSKSSNIVQAVKFMDWTFSDEGKELLSWGTEGETYNIVDGKRKYIDAANVTELRQKTGLSTPGLYTRFDFNAHIAAFSPELAQAATEDPKYDLEPAIPGIFTSEENEIAAMKGQAIQKSTDEMLSKFIIGERDLSEWDKYVQEIKALGLDDMFGIYKASHERIKNIK